MRSDGQCHPRRKGAARRLPASVALVVFALGVAIAGSGSGLAACTGEKSFVIPLLDAGAPGGRFRDVCNAWALRECAYADRCGLAQFDRWEDDAQCIARETLACELQADDPEVPFDPALVAACMPPADCSVPFVPVSADSESSLCLPAGKAPNAAPCVWGSGCQSGSCISNSTADGPGACGTCAPVIRCGCTSNQRCMVSGAEPKCFDLPDAGEACGAPLFACNASTCVASSDVAGTCQVLPEAEAGAACSTSPAGPDCSSGAVPLYCDATGHCATYVPATYGKPCTGDSGGEGSVCVGAGWCDAMGSGTCRAPAADGEPCHQLAPPCLPPARCLGAACVFPTIAACSP